MNLVTQRISLLHNYSQWWVSPFHNSDCRWHMEAADPNRHHTVQISVTETSPGEQALCPFNNVGWASLPARLFLAWCRQGGNCILSIASSLWILQEWNSFIKCRFPKGNGCLTLQWIPSPSAASMIGHWDWIQWAASSLPPDPVNTCCDHTF